MPTRPVQPTSRHDAARLPRGRHPLTQQAVAASQRVRLLDAVAKVVARKGYGAATVADVIALAGVSRRTFYEQFADLESCFLAAYEDGMLSLFDAIRRALADLPALPVEARIRCAVQAYLDALATRPEAGWAFTIEVLGAGRAALERRAWVMAQWVGRWRALLARHDDAAAESAPITDARLLALVGGSEELVRETLRHDGAAALPDIAGDLSELALVLLDIAPR
jgi:AcrR family transcriptional regulator